MRQITGIDLWDIENDYHLSGIQFVCGVDEAGRGPLAGPVCAAAVVLPKECILPGLNDSKKLSAKKREVLYDEIIEQAICYAVDYASVEEIDNLNILNATYLAMNRAISQLSVKPGVLLIDGNRKEGIQGNAHCIIKGDAKCACIAAASILAKVSRDRYMMEMSKIYPEYQFEKHKGYGTALHYRLIEQYGLCAIHRRSFLKRFL